MEKITTGKRKAIFDEEFENIFVDGSIAEFNALGFSFGDSISFTLDYGLTVEDIPYYSGYYAGVEELMLCGYPGDPHVKIARNCGDPTWEEFGMTEDTMIEVFLHEKGKYLEIEELFSLEYSDSIDDFPSLEAFANFRALHGGNIKPNYFYRSASPCDSWHHRAKTANMLCEKYGIQYVMNLSNSVEKYNSFLAKEDFTSHYYDSLYQNGNVALLLLNVNYRSYDFKKKIADGLLAMTKHKGPVLVHCAEGKDRTGFVCALIMSLANASYEDIVDDYMKTYDCYYNITKENEPKKYQAILDNIYDFLYSMCHADTSIDIKDLPLQTSAIAYLKEGGLNDTEIQTILDYINK